MADLAGLRVLVVEDEGAIALLIEDMLLELGCDIVASAAQLDRACALASALEIDLALLDLNLDGHSALPVAHILKDRRIPFLFSTGYGTSGIAEEFKSQPAIAKPFALADLRDKLLLILESVPA